MTAGKPSSLVGDDGVESQDPPPEGPFVNEPVLVEHDSPDGVDLRRAGEQIPRNGGEVVWDETIGRLPRP